MPDTERYLLCRPRGGLNDSLCLIASCHRFARDTGRTLVVDGVRSNFVGNFSSVFELIDANQPIVLHPSRSLMSRLDALPCCPGAVSGNLRRYRTTIHTPADKNPLEYRMPLDARTGTMLQVPLVGDPAEAVALVEAHSHGPDAVQFLSLCRLVPRLARTVRQRLRVLPSDPYVGVHIRNSDLRSQWRDFLDEQRPMLAGRNVVVCSDDREVLDAAPAMLGESQVTVTSWVPRRAGVPYQRGFVTLLARRRLVVDTLVDLFALAGATEVRHAPIVNRNYPSSSFTELARYLAASPGLSDQLLRVADLHHDATGDLIPPRN